MGGLYTSGLTILLPFDNSITAGKSEFATFPFAISKRARLLRFLRLGGATISIFLPFVSLSTKATAALRSVSADITKALSNLSCWASAIKWTPILTSVSFSSWVSYFWRHSAWQRIVLTLNRPKTTSTPRVFRAATYRWCRLRLDSRQQSVGSEVFYSFNLFSFTNQFFR